MNDTDVQEQNTDCKPKLHKNYKLVFQIGLVNHNVVPGSTKMLIQEHVTLGKNQVLHGATLFSTLVPYRAVTRHHGDFSVMGTSSLQPFLKSYWLTPVK